MENVQLLGVEDVQRAAARITQAGEQMERAAAMICESHDRQRAFLDEWLTRLEEVLNR